MENYIRFNVPKDLIEFEIEEKKKHNEKFGTNLDQDIVNIVYSTIENGHFQRKSNNISNIDGVLEYEEYEQNKLKKYR
ncbi:hypothetical protein KY313_00050 [Candidatus Woesearchaeota archaeon]|jgi:hypothetical protein|nr:hypothetical protein [Candidatus Woesearchaeota archaeon]